jgi:hypothetical protein
MTLNPIGLLSYPRFKFFFTPKVKTFLVSERRIVWLEQVLIDVKFVLIEINVGTFKKPNEFDPHSPYLFN